LFSFYLLLGCFFYLLVFVDLFYSSWQASRRGSWFFFTLALMLRWFFWVHCCRFLHGRRSKTCKCCVKHCKCSIYLSLIMLLW
jgi:hypothetical protein